MFGLCCYTSDTGQAEVAIWNMICGLSPNHRNDEGHTAWNFAHATSSLARYTTKMGNPTLILIAHSAAEIMLMAFLNQGCERPSSGFECHHTADVAECIRWIYALNWHGGTKLCTSQTITQSSGQQPAKGCWSHLYDTWLCLLHAQTTSYRRPVTHIWKLVLSHSLMQRERCGW